MLKRLSVVRGLLHPFLKMGRNQENSNLLGKEALSSGQESFQDAPPMAAYLSAGSAQNWRRKLAAASKK